jgi:hypothetical protein
MIKAILAWITGKSDTKAAEAPYKVETPTVDMSVGTDAVVVVKEAVVPAEVLPTPAFEVAPVTVKAKYKRVDLNKMTKKDLLALVAQHGLEVKARSTKEELVKVLAKV